MNVGLIFYCDMKRVVLQVSLVCFASHSAVNRHRVEGLTLSGFQLFYAVRMDRRQVVLLVWGMPEVVRL